MNLRPSLLLGAVLAVLLLPWLLLSEAQARMALDRGAYWAFLATVGLFAWSLAPIGRELVKEGRDRLVRAWKLVAGVLAVWFVLMVQQPFGFRSAAEVQGAGVSLSMHLDRLAAAAVKGLHNGITFQVSGRELAEAPLLHPFLLSLLHSLTGYRPENVFALNAGLLLILLGLAWCFGRRLGGPWQGGLLVALLASQPLLARSATGAGPHLLGLVLTLGALLLALRALASEEPASLQALGLCGILLTGAVVPWVGTLAAVLAMVLWARRRNPAPLPSWIFLLPLLLLPAVLRLRGLGLAGFNLAGLKGNLAPALASLFDASRGSAQSIVCSVVGLMALPFFLLRLKRAAQSPGGANPGDVVIAAIALGSGLDALLILGGPGGFEGGQLTPGLGLRLGLTLALTTLSAASQLDPGRWAWRGLGTGLAAGFFLVSLPAMSRRAYTMALHEAPELAWKRAFLAGRSLRDAIVLDRDPRFWTVHKVSATSIQEVSAKEGAAKAILDNRHFRVVYVCQRLELDPRNREWVLPPGENLAEAHGLEPVAQARVTPMVRLRISRLLPAGQGSPASAHTVRDPLAGIPVEARDAVRETHLRRFMEALP